jgi:hypothetical protein
MVYTGPIGPTDEERLREALADPALTVEDRDWLRAQLELAGIEPPDPDLWMTTEEIRG